MKRLFPTDTYCKNKITTILRVEHPYDGYGMFNSRNADGTRHRQLTDDIENALDRMTMRHSDFPSPLRDKLLENLNIDEFCAFKSIDQFNEWVTNAEQKVLINDCGFRILLLDVTNCRIGEFQNVYTKDNVVSCKDISEMFL